MLLGFVFVWICLMGAATSNMFVWLTAGVMASAWLAAHFVPMPCNCVTSCGKGRCERG